MRFSPVLAFVAMLVCSPLVMAQPPEAQSQEAKTPAESLRCIQARPGFTVELMAAEPLVMSPIAFAWGPDGKFWVVEMGDYPLGIDGKGNPGGRIKFLEKSRPGDGPYDKATVFMDGLAFPTGVTPYGKGVLVTCAPDIFYAEDTDGDGKADKKEVLFTGFREGNQQHRVNGLVWGLDNWFYGANGDSGGKVKSLKTGKIVDISGRDFRLKPDTGEFETVTGQTQFGRCRDDWGNWFGCNNSNPLYHFVLDDHYLRRNPFLLPPDVRVSVSETPGASRVYPISKPLARFNNPQSLNHFTSACSAMIYRDDLFGPEFVGNSFVSEPVHNLIHREIVKPRGVTFTSRRADDEKESEFLASSDNWFRPTTIATGPDGALWVADMYRYVIEHPEWIPKDWQKKLDLRAGHDKGRIYRVYPKGKQTREIANLSNAPVDELCRRIESANGWTRDTAQQLLIRLSDRKQRIEAHERLLKVVALGAPRSRVQALCAIEGIKNPPWRLTEAIDHALQDRHPLVRKHAIRCTESSEDGFDFLLQKSHAARLMNEDDLRVKMQFGYSLGSWDRTDLRERLARFLCEEAQDRYVLAAALSSVNPAKCKDIIARISECPTIPMPVFVNLLRAGGDRVDAATLGTLLNRLQLKGLDDPGAGRLARLAELFEAIGRDGKLLTKLLQGTKGAAADVGGTLQRALVDARKIATDPRAAVPDRSAAVRLLGHGLGNDRDDYKVISTLLTPQTPDRLQVAAIQSLGSGVDPNIARVLIAAWKGYTPALRAQALDVLLMRRTWTRELVDAMERKQIPPSEIDTVRRARLMQHAESDIRDTASKLFAASSNPDRGKIVDEYILTLPEKTDGKRGARLFAKVCAACHKLGDVGQQVGPDLASVGDRSISGLLVAILDPNRAVEARYVNYLATTRDGRTLTGLIASETSTSVKLVSADGKAHDLLRGDLDELASTGKSLMPEGLEKDLPPQEMADLLAYLRGSLPPLAPKAFPGNQPAVVRPDKDGSLILSATNAAIFGPTLIFEPKYRNLGYWSSAADRAVWTLEVPRALKFSPVFDYACDPNSAGNQFVLEVAGRTLTATVKSTGSWNNYESRNPTSSAGSLIEIPAGRHELTLRSQGPPGGALMDLKEIKLVPRR